MNSRKTINKHKGYNQTAERMAIKAININGTVRDGFTNYSYDRDTNTLIISDGMTVDIYNPQILDSDLIFPFANHKAFRIGNGIATD